MTVSMRTIAKHQLEKAFMISNQYPDYHGAPIHIGDPTRIGISGVTVPDGYVATFWACGMTVEDVILIASKSVVMCSRPITQSLVLSHDLQLIKVVTCPCFKLKLENIIMIII